MTAHPSRLHAFQKSTEVQDLAFPLPRSSQNGPRRQGFARPRLSARPWRLRAVL